MFVITRRISALLTEKQGCYRPLETLQDSDTRRRRDFLITH